MCQDYQEILTNQVGRNEQLAEAIRTAPEKAVFESRVNDLRTKLNQASDPGDTQKADEILKELEKVKADSLELTRYQDNYDLGFDDANSNIENYFTGSAKIELMERVRVNA